jgi:glucokinase
VILGIDFGGTKMAVGLADDAGGILVQRRLDTDAAAGADQAVDRALALAEKLVAERGSRLGAPAADAPDRDGSADSGVGGSDGALRAIGVASPGIVLPDRILLAPNVPGWERLRLADRVRARFGGLPVAVGTDAKAAALAESRWGALVGADPGIFLSLGTGLAAAIVLGGRVLDGANGASGEIGYNLRGADDPGGYATGSASLEEAVGGRALGRRATALAGRPTTAAELFAAAGHDPAAAALLDEALTELAVHVANLANVVDPRRIAVGGGLVASADQVFAVLRRVLDRAVPFPPELVVARFTQDGALRGALALAQTALS